jgi:phosphohistidine phosphatase
MDLYIIRHAWAGHAGDPQWPDDAQRPLSEEGKQRFAQVVARLVERGFAPEIVATSPLLRCLQTAQVVSDGVPGSLQVVPLDELRPGSNLEGLLAWTARHSRRQQVAWVGHAPDVDRLAAALIGEPAAAVHFAKGGVAAIRFEDRPQIGQGELRWLITAKVLGC